MGRTKYINPHNTIHTEDVTTANRNLLSEGQEGAGRLFVRSGDALYLEFENLSFFSYILSLIYYKMATEVATNPVSLSFITSFISFR